MAMTMRNSNNEEDINEDNNDSPLSMSTFHEGLVASEETLEGMLTPTTIVVDSPNESSTGVEMESFNESKDDNLLVPDFIPSRRNSKRALYSDDEEIALSMQQVTDKKVKKDDNYQLQLPDSPMESENIRMDLPDNNTTNNKNENQERYLPKNKGIVKWFELKKGFGFLVREHDGEDVFCHQSSLYNSYGQKGVIEGSEVLYDYESNSSDDHKWKCTRVTGLDGGPVQGIDIHLIQKNRGGITTFPEHTTNQLADGRYRGTCKWWNRAKGFGFITPLDNSDDVFIHHKDIACAPGGYRSLAEGENVEFSFDLEHQKLSSKRKALNCTGPGGKFCVGQAKPSDQQNQNQNHSNNIMQMQPYPMYNPYNFAYPPNAMYNGNPVSPNAQQYTYVYPMSPQGMVHPHQGHQQQYVPLPFQYPPQQSQQYYNPKQQQQQQQHFQAQYMQAQQYHPHV